MSMPFPDDGYTVNHQSQLDPQYPSSPYVQQATPPPPPPQRPHVVRPVAPVAPPKQEKHFDTRIVNVARALIMPLSLADILVVVSRMMIGGSAALFPTFYAGYESQPWGRWFDLAFLLSLGLSCAVAVPMWLSRIAQLETRKRSTIYIKRRVAREARKSQINEQLRQSRQNLFVMGVIVTVPLIIVFFKDFADWMKYVIALTDMIAPMIAIYSIGLADYEINDEDPSQETMFQSFQAIKGALQGVAVRVAANAMNSQDVVMLKKGKEGDVDTMLDVAIPYNPQDEWLTISAICKRYGWLDVYNAKARQKVTYLVRKALEKGVEGIRKGGNGQGYHVLNESLPLVIPFPAEISKVDQIDRQIREAASLVASGVPTA